MTVLSSPCSKWIDEDDKHKKFCYEDLIEQTLKVWSDVMLSTRQHPVEEWQATAHRMILRRKLHHHSNPSCLPGIDSVTWMEKNLTNLTHV